MTSIGGVNLGVIESESHTKSSGLFNMPMPLSDSDEALLMDIFGCSRTITIMGIKTGVIADLRTFITNIENLITGSQSSMVFVSSWTNVNKDVLIQDFTHDKIKAGESQVSYTLTLVEGTVL